MITIKKIYPLLVILTLAFIVVNGSVEEANAAEGGGVVSWYTDAGLVQTSRSDIGYLALSNLAANIIAENGTGVSDNVQQSSYMVYDGTGYKFLTQCNSVSLVKKTLDRAGEVWVMSEIGEVLAAVLGILQMPLTIHDLTFTFWQIILFLIGAGAVVFLIVKWVN